jgi:hypothetical protein
MSDKALKKQTKDRVVTHLPNGESKVSGHVLRDVGDDREESPVVSHAAEDETPHRKTAQDFPPRRCPCTDLLKL